MAGLSLSAAAQDRSKKAYELMYEDIQLLKIQTQRIEKKIDQAGADLKVLGELVRDLAAQFKDFRIFQARNQEGWSEIPGGCGASRNSWPRSKTAFFNWLPISSPPKRRRGDDGRSGGGGKPSPRKSGQPKAGGGARARPSSVRPLRPGSLSGGDG